MTALLTRPPLNPTRDPFPVQVVTLPEGKPAARKHKVIAVLPAFNAARTLAATVGDIPPGSVDEVLLVDDNSKDNTVKIARDMGHAPAPRSMSSLLSFDAQPLDRPAQRSAGRGAIRSGGRKRRRREQNAEFSRVSGESSDVSVLASGWSRTLRCGPSILPLPEGENP